MSELLEDLSNAEAEILGMLSLLYAEVRHWEAELGRARKAKRAASGDTHPKGGDAQQAPLVSGAVPEGQTPKVQRHD